MAAAQDFTPSTDRILSDPTYLPLQGQIYGETGYDYGSVTGNTNSAAGTAFSRNWTNTYSQYTAYGVTNRLSFNLGIDYETDHSRDTSAAGLVTGAGRQGFDNPTLGVTYRLIDQTNHPFLLDLKGTYTPDAFPSKTPAGISDGTIAYGGSQGSLGVALGRETKMFTVQASVTGKWQGPTDEQNMVNGDTIHTSGFWAPTLGLATQTRITPRLSVNVNGDYTFNGSPNVVNEDNGVFYQSNRGNYGDLGVAVNYHVIPNRVVGSLGYTHTFFGQTDNVFPVDPDRDAALTRASDTFGATVRYVFR
jgi:hypothetical protein